MADFSLNASSQDEIGNPNSADVPRDEGLRLFQLETILAECRQQPNWRLQADIEADYYDGNQLDAETLWAMEERGQAPLITNLIKPTIDVVLGMEAKTRTDWKVRSEADDEAGDDLADALSVKLHKAEVESRADRACSDAYAHQIKVGLGWVEVSRESDPLKGAYRVQSVHRREIFWDWRAKQPDLSDARWLIRRQWLDEDIVTAAFPNMKRIVGALVGSTPINDLLMDEDTGLAQSLDVARGSSIDQSMWLNIDRRLVCVYEVWYRKVVRGHVIRLPNGRVVEFKLDDEKHVSAALAGIVNPQPATFMKPHLSWWIGPHKCHDGPSPYRHQNFPYVPFVGFREDRTSIPYGLIRTMKSPQDEVNARKSKMMWLLSSRRVVADSDAVEDHNQAAAEVARPDAYVILNANRKPTSQFAVEDGGQMANQQFEVMKEAKNEINQSAGVYQSMLGANSNATSGTALNTLVEQGSTTLAEINDNARYARRQVGEILFELVKEDNEGRPISVKVGDGLTEKVIVLNQLSRDEKTSQPIILNNVSRVHTRVVLDDVTSSPTFKAQQQAQLMELTKALPPQAQSLIIDFVIESTDLPKRREMADRLRKGLGIQTGNGEQDQEKAQMRQQIEQLTGALQEAQTAPQLNELAAKIDKLMADAALSRARAYEIVEGVEAVERDERKAGIPEGDPIEKEVEEMVFANA